MMLRPSFTPFPNERKQVAFNQMVAQRPLWISFLLEEGFTVLNCDLDIVVLRDPVPLMLSMANNHDMLFQSEGGYGLNGGWYLALPTNNTKHFFAIWLERLAQEMDNRHFEEQHMLNGALNNVRKNNQLRVRVLPSSGFPNGKIWQHYHNMANKTSAYMVHMNWVKSNKKTRLARDNLWFLDELDHTCIANFDPAAFGCQHLCAPVAGCIPGKKCIFYDCRMWTRIQHHYHPIAFRHPKLPNCSITNASRLKLEEYAALDESTAV